MLLTNYMDCSQFDDDALIKVAFQKDIKPKKNTRVKWEV